MSEIKIPVSSPKLGEEEQKNVIECIKSSWISAQGPYVREFEKAFSSYCGVKYGISTSSGTTSLHLALAALGLGPGDEVIIPSFTMVATANSVRYTGADIKLVDSEPDYWNIDVTKIEEKITPRTKAIMVVHTYGHPVDMDPVMEIARRHNLKVVEDAAEAHGAEYKGRRAGGIGDCGCFSFYANKIITTGEGGMIVTDDEELANVAGNMRAHSFSEDQHFWHRRVGFNYRMSSLQAAVGMAQIERLDNYVQNRRRNAQIYNSWLGKIPGIKLPPEASWAKSVFWMYSILIEDEFGLSRDKLMERLEAKGIETRTFFFPLHIQPIYAERFQGEEFPVADYIARQGMNLPSGNTLTEEEIETVSKAIKDSRS